MAKNIVTNEELADITQQILDIMTEGLDDMTVIITNKNSVKEVRLDGNVFELLIQHIVASN